MTSPTNLQVARPANPADYPSVSNDRQYQPGAAYPNFDNLPDTAWVRQAQLIRHPRKPGMPVPLPFSAATLWRKVADGTFPQPFKLSERMTVWRVADVRAWMREQATPAATQRRAA